MPARVVLTYRDYQALPADGRRYEPHEGELLVTAAPGVWQPERSERPAANLLERREKSPQGIRIPALTAFQQVV